VMPGAMGGLVARLTITPELANGYGTVHGGLLGTRHARHAWPLLLCLQPWGLDVEVDIAHLIAICAVKESRGLLADSLFLQQET
jgi:hypothetical protein